MDKIEILPYTHEEYRNRYGAGAGDRLDPQTEVRTFTTSGIRMLLQALQPYVDGTFGDVSPRHAHLYLDGLKELNHVWNARYTPGLPGGLEGEARMTQRVEQRREQVLGMLDALRSRGNST